MKSWAAKVFYRRSYKDSWSLILQTVLWWGLVTVWHSHPQPITIVRALLLLRRQLGLPSIFNTHHLCPSYQVSKYTHDLTAQWYTFRISPLKSADRLPQNTHKHLKTAWKLRRHKKAKNFSVLISGGSDQQKKKKKCFSSYVYAIQFSKLLGCMLKKNVMISKNNFNIVGWEIYNDLMELDNAQLPRKLG